MKSCRLECRTAKLEEVSPTKTIHSRSNKNIGDIIEQKWEITAKTVIAEPLPGDRNLDIPPRLGIYDYEVKPIVQETTAKAGSTKRQPEPSVGGTRREASSVPLTVRRIS
jgi:hypothetical protein